LKLSFAGEITLKTNRDAGLPVEDSNLESRLQRAVCCQLHQRGTLREGRIWPLAS
jgi:hypothetical protein